MGFSIQDVIGGTFLDSVKGIISQFHMSPEDKAKLQAQIEQEKDVFAQAENDYNARLNDIAGQNIRAEAQSGDNYTRRARPSVIWIGLFVIVWNYCGPYQIINHYAHLGLTSVDLPQWFWESWGVICTGYVFNRTAEKVMAMPGTSEIKLPLGLGSMKQSTNGN
jgi:hypothetical protein